MLYQIHDGVKVYKSVCMNNYEMLETGAVLRHFRLDSAQISL